MEGLAGRWIKNEGKIPVEHLLLLALWCEKSLSAPISGFLFLLQTRMERTDPYWRTINSSWLCPSHFRYSFLYVIVPQFERLHWRPSTTVCQQLALCNAHHTVSAHLTNQFFDFHGSCNRAGRGLYDLVTVTACESITMGLTPCCMNFILIYSIRSSGGWRLGGGR